MSLKLKLFTLLSLAITFCILSALFILVLENNRSSERAWVEHTHDVILASNNLLRRLVDAESGQRGFLLTENRKYLEPYHKAINQIIQNINFLEELTADNTSQQALLEKIRKNIELKLAELASTINLAANDKDQAIEVVKSNFGQTYMNDLREQISQLIETEEKLLSKRRSKLQSTSHLIWYFLVIELLGLLIIAIFTHYIIKKEFTRPLEMLISGINKLRPGKDVENISADEKGEMGKLIDTFSKASKEIKENESALYYSATHDELTGLKNRRYLIDHLGTELKRAERNKDFLSLIYLDVNNFKQVNDTKGHAAGDAVLNKVASNILRQIRMVDIACRIGGDEFCIILPSASPSDAHNIANRIVAECESDMNLHDISLSVGIAACGSSKYADAETLLIMADKLMYESKAKFRIENGSHISSRVYS